MTPFSICVDRSTGDEFSPFLFVKIVSFLLHFWRTVLADIEFSVEFCLSGLRIHHLMHSGMSFSNEKGSLILLLRIPCMAWVLFSCCFKDFLCLLKFDYDVSRCGSLWFYPTWSSLNFLDVLDTCFSLKLGFSPLFLQISFLLIQYLFSF